MAMVERCGHASLKMGEGHHVRPHQLHGPALFGTTIERIYCNCFRSILNVVSYDPSASWP